MPVPSSPAVRTGRLGSPRPAQLLGQSSASTAIPGVESKPPTAGVRVAIRVRPLLPREAGQREGIRVHADERSVVILDDRGQERTFVADTVLDSRRARDMGNSEGESRDVYSSGAEGVCGAAQNAVFKAVGADLVRHAIEGYNACLLAYGHTGSGKTYTILGEEWVKNSGGATVTAGCSGDESAAAAVNAGAGLLPRALEAIFSSIQREPSAVCIASFFEIHNERIRDLIAPVHALEDVVGGGACFQSRSGNSSQGQQARRPTVHFHPRFGAFVSNITEVPCLGLDEALRLISLGARARTTAATALNDRSSRSHAVFTLRIERTAASNNLMLVDLAGREQERLTHCRTERFKELTLINRSLFHLTRCVRALTAQSSNAAGCSAPVGPGGKDGGQWHHFRNSKLTMVLGHALAGNSHTAVLGTLSPACGSYEDSLSTLRFCESVKQVRTRPALPGARREDVVHELQDEVRRLETELLRARSGRALVEQQLSEAHAMMEHYRNSWQQAVEVSTKGLIVRLQEETNAALASFGCPPAAGQPPAALLCLLPMKSTSLHVQGKDMRSGNSSCKDGSVTPRRPPSDRTAPSTPIASCKHIVEVGTGGPLPSGAENRGSECRVSSLAYHDSLQHAVVSMSERDSTGGGHSGRPLVTAASPSGIAVTRVAESQGVLSQVECGVPAILDLSKLIQCDGSAAAGRDDDFDHSISACGTPSAASIASGESTTEQRFHAHGSPSLIPDLFLHSSNACGDNSSDGTAPVCADPTAQQPDEDLMRVVDTWLCKAEQCTDGTCDAKRAGLASTLRKLRSQLLDLRAARPVSSKATTQGFSTPGTLPGSPGDGGIKLRPVPRTPRSASPSQQKCVRDQHSGAPAEGSGAACGCKSVSCRFADSCDLKFAASIVAMLRRAVAAEGNGKVASDTGEGTVDLGTLPTDVSAIIRSDNRRQTDAQTSCSNAGSAVAPAHAVEMKASKTPLIWGCSAATTATTSSGYTICTPRSGGSSIAIAAPTATGASTPVWTAVLSPPQPVAFPARARLGSTESLSARGAPGAGDARLRTGRSAACSSDGHPLFARGTSDRRPGGSVATLVPAGVGGGLDMLWTPPPQSPRLWMPGAHMDLRRLPSAPALPNRIQLWRQLPAEVSGWISPRLAGHSPAPSPPVPLAPFLLHGAGGAPPPVAGSSLAAPAVAKSSPRSLTSPNLSPRPAPRPRAAQQTSPIRERTPHMRLVHSERYLSPGGTRTAREVMHWTMDLLASPAKR